MISHHFDSAFILLPSRPELKSISIIKALKPPWLRNNPNGHFPIQTQDAVFMGYLDTESELIQAQNHSTKSMPKR